LLIHGAKQVKPGNTAESSGYYKVGNPYQIKSVWYYPQDDPDYTETGIASWYGPGFHGKQTANGEIFDENDITAAHRTLPMPSVVRVTNLGNGRSIVVRVNDRGPFAHGRIIDLSRRAAQLLGFERNGTARVRVDLLPSESEQARAVARGDTPQFTQVAQNTLPEAAPSGRVAVASISAPSGVRVSNNTAIPAPKAPLPSSNVNIRRSPDEVIVMPVAQDTELYIQAGAFQSRENANRLSSSLRSIGTPAIQVAEVAGKTFYRVRLGPLQSVEVADAMLERVIDAGYPGSTIVVE
jgi:rare lipoprotein A